MRHGEYPEADRGKCRSCGFLSKHARSTSRLPPPRFYEVEHFERESPDSFKRHTVDHSMPAATEPMCFVGETNLMEKFEQGGNAKLLEAILYDRKCGQWYAYMPGFSPKEHYEEYQMQRLENDRRAFELKLSEMAAAAQKESAAIAQDSKQLVAELKTIAEKSEKSSKRVAWLVILLAIAQVIVGLIALFHESYTDRFLRGIFGP